MAALPSLRFLTCGSVDDGKSTLIGRLLWEQNLILDDQLSALRADSRKHGTDGANIDFALLVDGLEAEREQGITIDVAYRYFATPRRSFIVADTPGHEQYTRNMATGASNAELAILLVDARKGLLTQTCRHASIVALLGIKSIVLAVNKCDLVGWDRATFETIVAAFTAFAAPLGFAQVLAVPLSARHGDNLSARSAHTPWYAGPTLLEHLETVVIAPEPTGAAFRLPVQWVNRPNLDFRGFAGTIAGGTVKPGDPVVVAGSGVATTVARVLGPDGDVPQAAVGDAVTVTLAQEVDVARGDVLAAADARPTVADQFAAHLIWMGDEKLLPGRSYWLKLGASLLPASVTEIKHRVDPATQAHHAAKTLSLNEIGFANLATSSPIAFAPYTENRDLGAFILIDRTTNATAAAGMIAFGLRRATNVHLQSLAVSRDARARLKGQRPMVLWFTGLSGAGKSTVANIVDATLHARGVHTVMLDGDNIRHGLSKDLGFTDADRVENIRRVGEVARLMADAGLVVLCSFISPYRAERAMVRTLMPPGEFLEVFVDASVDTCIARDPKGLYARALKGEIKHFTGIDAPYEAPEDADLTLDADHESPHVMAARVVGALGVRDVIGEGWMGEGI